MTYKKRDISYHSDGSSSAWHGGTDFPAVNVKHRGGCFQELKEAFPQLSDKKIEDVGNTAWEMSREYFWDTFVARTINNVWGDIKPSFDADGKRVYKQGSTIEFTAAGRSDGWLVVTSLGNVDIVHNNWNAVDVCTWGRFESLVHAEVLRLNSAECLIYAVNQILKENAKQGE